MSSALVRTGFALFSAVRSHKEWPHRRQREAPAFILQYTFMPLLPLLYRIEESIV